MKAIVKTLVCASLFAGVISSCSDEFFHKTPNGALDAGKIDDTSLTYLRNTMYAYKGANMSGYSAPFMDGYADNGYSRNAWDSHGASVQGNSLTASQDFGYISGFAGIRACNLFLENLDKFNISAEQKAKGRGEAKVIRAWLYMDLTLRFGDLPHIVERSNDYPEGLSRTSAKDIRKFVLTELEEAIGLLPERNGAGLIDKYQAQALMARAAYYFGEYEKALSAAKSVIESGRYRLHEVSGLGINQADADYFKKLYTNTGGVDVDGLVKGIFNYMELWSKDNSPETIISEEYQATEEKSSYLRVTAYQSPNMSNKQAWATIVPIQELVDAYWLVDGKTKPTLGSKEERKNQYLALEKKIDELAQNSKITKTKAVSDNLAIVLDDPYMAQYKNRDPRLYASVVFPYASINRYKAGEYQVYLQDIVNYGKSGFVFRKFSSPDDLVSLWGDGYHGTGVDWPMIRLAEMYLIAAESHTQVTAYDATAQAYLNPLRIRVGMPNVPTSFVSKGEALDFIRHERRIELAGEGLRFFDIRLYEDNTRNGGHKGSEAASEVMKGQIFDVTGNPGAKLTWASRLNLLPYPTSVLDKNKKEDAKKNNPGY